MSSDDAPPPLLGRAGTRRAAGRRVREDEPEVGGQPVPAHPATKPLSRIGGSLGGIAPFMGGSYRPPGGGWRAGCGP